MTTTPKYGIPELDPNGLVKNGPADVNTALAAIDSTFAGFSAGPIASRPISTAGSPGVAGRLYRATDTGQVFIDTGTSWLLLAPIANGSITPDMLATVPQARLGRSTSQSIPTGASTFTPISFDTEIYDLGTSPEQHSVGAPTKLICQRAGLYTIGGHLNWAVNNTNIRQIALRWTKADLSDVELLAFDLREATTSGGLAETTQNRVETDYRLAVGDYVELVATQDSGAALIANGTPNLGGAALWWSWRSP